MKVSWCNNPVLLGLISASPSQDAFEHILWNDLNEYLKEANVISSSTPEDVQLLIGTIVQFLPLVGVVVVHKQQRQPTTLKLPTKKVAHFLVPKKHKDFHHAAYLAELIMLAQDYDPIGLLLHWCVFTLHHILRYSVDYNVNLIQTRALDATNTSNVGILFMNALQHCPTYDTYLSTMLAFLAAQIVLLSSSSSQSSLLLLDELLGWVCDGLSKASSIANSPPSSSPTSLHCIFPTLVTLVSENKPARIVFVQHGGIGYLSKHLRGTNTNSSPSSSGNPFLFPSFPSTSSSYSKDIILTRKETKNVEPVQPMPMNHIDTRQQQMIRRDMTTSRQQQYSRLQLSQTEGEEEKKSSIGRSSFASSPNVIPISYSSLLSSSSTLIPTLGKTATSGSSKSGLSMNPIISTFSIPSGTTTISGVSQQMYYLTFCLWTLSCELFLFNEHEEPTTTNNLVYQ
jgi:hypothetical protein